MGPLFFRAENDASNDRIEAGRGFNGAALFQSGERVFPSIEESRIKSFNGAALFQSGEQKSPQHRQANAAASMGPLFFRAENPGRFSRHERAAFASMGPLFFRAENSVNDKIISPLQGFNGAALFQSGELATNPSCSLWSWQSFNGAALFQSGEPTAENGITPSPVCFNGAALFQSGERHAIPTGHLGSCASMGPLFFRAENAP